MDRTLLVVIVVGAGIALLIPSEQAPLRPQASEQPAAIAAAGASSAASRSPATPWRPAAEMRLSRSANGHFHADALVNGAPIRFVVDTGATIVALTMADAQRAGIVVDPARFGVVATGAGGPVRGQEIRIDRIDLGGKEVRDVRAVVLEALGVSLLGQSYLSGIAGVTISGEEMVLH